MTVTMLREPVMTVTIMAVVRDDHDDASDKNWGDNAQHDDDHDCTQC